VAAREAVMLAQVSDLAALYRWRHAHWHDSRREVKPGVFVGDKAAAGYPDCTLVRDRLLVAELKRQGETPRADQVEWLDALASAGVETYLWTLDDLDDVRRILAGKWSYARHFLSLTPAGRRWTPASLWIPGHGRSDA
jgi:hypothetical protein